MQGSAWWPPPLLPTLPLWVTEQVAQHGISGNWLWWNMLIGGMLTTFFFAKLWRRAEVLTELEFIELRYSGKLARILRLFKAVYLGLFLNIIIIGWVNFALITIFKVFFDVDVPEGTPWYENPLYIAVAAAMLFVAAYSSLAGLLGVAITDTLQFFVAMTATILLAYYVFGYSRNRWNCWFKGSTASLEVRFFSSSYG